MRKYVILVVVLLVTLCVLGFLWLKYNKKVEMYEGGSSIRVDKKIVNIVKQLTSANKEEFIFRDLLTVRLHNELNNSKIMFVDVSGLEEFLEKMGFFVYPENGLDYLNGRGAAIKNIDIYVSAFDLAYKYESGNDMQVYDVNNQMISDVYYKVSPESQTLELHILISSDWIKKPTVLNIKGLGINNERQLINYQLGNALFFTGSKGTNEALGLLKEGKTIYLYFEQYIRNMIKDSKFYFVSM